LSNQPLHSSLTIIGLSGQSARVCWSFSAMPLQPLRNSAQSRIGPIQVYCGTTIPRSIAARASVAWC
jgi:hypothetical protein